MFQRIFRLVYCSRARLPGGELERKAQLSSLLRTTRARNARAGVTGALFCNTVLFAQVLEGDFVSVQRALERIQADHRHSDLVVLHCGYAPERCFGDWSMAFACTLPEYPLPLSRPLHHEAALTGRSLNGDQVLAFLREVVVRAETWSLPMPGGVTPPALERTAPGVLAQAS